MEKKSVIKKNKYIEKHTQKSDNKKTKLKKAINIIEYLVIFIIIFVNALFIVKSIKNPNKTPDLQGKKAFIIVSGSMIPTINIGDVVIIHDTNQIQVNDIIAFRKDSMVIVHRVIKEMNVSGQVMYQTKGDNNNIADLELVDISTVEGVYSFKIPFIGKILLFLYENLAIIVVTIMLILIIKYFFEE